MGEATQATTVAVEGGRIRGAREGDVVAFRGVPYAAPPTGARRWRPPAAVEPWSGVRDAAHFADDCVQAAGPNLRGPAISEDGLSLNVWTRAERTADPMPVMVWIPGGGFVGGSGSDRRADGARLAAVGVVVVTVSYRVGLFGFLAHPALSAEGDGASGNYGLMDVAAAFRWVRANIAAFGGDPDNVTAFGVSAGSASIALLMTSPGFDGLFDRAILQSPGAFRPLTALVEAEAAGLALGDDIDRLRAMDAQALFRETSKLTPARRALTGPRPLRPIKDGRLLVEDDRDAWRAGRFARMPLIVGGMTDEGSAFTAGWDIDTGARYADFLAETFGPAAPEANALYQAAAIPARLADLFGDTQFAYGAWGIADAAARQVAHPVWRYLLTRHPGGRTAPPRHGEDVAFVFGNLEWADADDGAVDATDRAVSDALLAAWVRFAGGAAPRPDWPPHAHGATGYLEFGDIIQEARDWRTAEIAFLDRYYDSRPSAP